MLTTLLSVLAIALVLFIIYWLIGKFIQGTPLQIVGAILAIILLIVALQKFGFAGSLGL